MVLGVVLLAVILMFVACSGGNDKGNNRAQTNATRTSGTPSAGPSASTPDEQPSFTDPVPGGGGPSLPAPGDLTSQQPSLDNGTGTGQSAAPDGTNTNVTAPAGALCTDAEMSLTPVPVSATVKRGTPVAIRLKIKNISQRTCSRDVGAGPQELYLDQGARKYWSSDTCSTARTSDVRQFTPGAEREYSVTWNGRQSSTCQGGNSAGPAPIPGQYDLRGRLGTKISDPVTLTIVA